MSERACVFLRGINVNGVSIKMDALREVFAAMGYADVKTVQATGNVVVSISRDGQMGMDERKARMERELSAAFGYDAHVLVRGKSELAAFVSAARSADIAQDCHGYCVLTDDKALPAALALRFASLPHEPNERFDLLAGEGLWIVPKGRTLESAFGKAVLGAKIYKNALTTRNVNTLERVLKAMD